MVDKIKEDRIYGQAAVEAFYKKREKDLIRLFVREGEQGRFGEILSACAKKKQLYRLVPNAELSVLAKSEHHEGICAIVKPKEAIPLDRLLDLYQKGFNKGPILVLDGVSNPHNVGAIIRSAVFYGNTNIVINTKTRFNLSGSLARMSEGGLEYASIAFSRDTNFLIQSMKKRGFKILSSDLEAKECSITEDFLEGPFALVLGSESQGISKEFLEHSDHRFRLKGAGIIQSLNVSVFAGIMFNEFYEHGK